MNIRKSLLKDIAISLFTFVFLLLICEIGIRLYDLTNGRNFFDNSHRDILTKKPKKTLAFRNFGVDLYKEVDGKTYIQSSHGELFPLIKSENTFRIVCFGGSTTRNSYAYSKAGIHYPLLLQKKLTSEYPNKIVEVINVSYEAYASPHSLITLLLNVVSWSADLVTIMHNHNDLSASYWPNFRFDYTNKYEADFYQESSYYDNYTTINFVFRWSSFYWFIKEKYDGVFRNKENQVKTIKSYGNKPIKEAIKIFERNLGNFARIAKVYVPHIVFMTQPLNKNGEYSDFTPFNKSKMVWPTHEEYNSHHFEFNKVIIEIAKSNNIHILDNNLLFESNSEYFIDALHYTEEGVKKISQNLFDFIKKYNLVK